MSPFPTNEQQDPEPLSAQWQHLHDAYAELTQDQTPEVLTAYLAQYVSLKEACVAHALALDDAQLSVQLMKDLRAINVVIFMTPTAEKKSAAIGWSLPYGARPFFTLPRRSCLPQRGDALVCQSLNLSEEGVFPWAVVAPQR